MTGHALKAKLCAAALWLALVAGTVGSEYVLPVTQDQWWYQALEWLLGVVPIALWVHFDGRARGHADHAAYVFASLVIAPIAAPVYVWRTRGIRGLIKWLLWTALLIISALLVCFLLLIVLPDPDWAV